MMFSTVGDSVTLCCASPGSQPPVFRRDSAFIFSGLNVREKHSLPGRTPTSSILLRQFKIVYAFIVSPTRIKRNLITLKITTKTNDNQITDEIIDRTKNHTPSSDPGMENFSFRV
jgi:hypothetical protein